MLVKLLSCIGTDKHISNPNLLHHFIRYYQNLGITEWEITLHTGTEQELNNLAVFQAKLAEYQIPYQIWEGEYNTHYREQMHNEFVLQQSDCQWVLGVDLDEFVEFPCQIPDYLENLDEQGYNCVSGNLIDRVSVGGILPFIEKNIPLEQQFPLKANVKKNICKPLYPETSSEKKLAIKKPLQWGTGHHTLKNDCYAYLKESPEALNINHYAWDSLLRARIEYRYKTYSQQPEIFPWIDQYKNLLEYLTEYNKFQLTDIEAVRIK